MLKNGLKLQYYLMRGPKLGGWEGSAEVQPKAQVLHFFWKPSLCATTVSIKPHIRLILGDMLKINIAIIKLQRKLKVGAEWGKKLQATKIGLCPGIKTLRPLSYSSVGKLSKF